MWNKKPSADDEPSLPYLKAIKQSLAWEGIRVNLVYRRFYSSYDLGLLLEEVRRRGAPSRSATSPRTVSGASSRIGDK